MANCAAAKQIGMTAPDFPCAGATKNESMSHVFNQPVNFIEDPRNFLHLVDDDNLRSVDSQEFFT